MLKQRILTALVLIPLVVAGILYLSKAAIALIFAVVVLQGAWEWSAMAGLKHKVIRLLYVAVAAAGLFFLWPGTGDRFLMETTGYLSAAWWVLAFVWILVPGVMDQRSVFSTVLKLFFGTLVLLPLWMALVSIHSISDEGPVWLLSVMVIVWVADSGAYFAGKAFGKHKLAPRVSPGKTWEGVMGAVVLVLLYTLVATYWLPVEGDARMWFILAGLLLVPVSVIGDLFESLMKRHSGIKDSGQLLPGHGGILDRIDGLTPAIPLFMLVALVTGII